jgi:hypothetical protein
MKREVRKTSRQTFFLDVKSPVVVSIPPSHPPSFTPTYHFSNHSTSDLVSQNISPSLGFPCWLAMYLIEACAILLISGLKLAALVLAIVGITQY